MWLLFCISGEWVPLNIKHYEIYTNVFNTILFGNTVISYTAAHKTLKNTYTASKRGAASFCQSSALSFTVMFMNLDCIFCKEIK